MLVSASSIRRIGISCSVVGILTGGIIQAQTATEDAPAATTPTDAAVEAASSESPKQIEVSEAKQNMGKVCVVRYRVASSTLIEAKKICFLNSQRNHRSDENFTVIIKSDDLEKFASAGVADPSDHYYKKMIEVTGKITEHNGRPQMVIREVKDISIIKEELAEAASNE